MSSLASDTIIIAGGTYAGVEVTWLFRGDHTRGVSNNVRDSATLYFLVRHAASETDAIGAVGCPGASALVPHTYGNAWLSSLNTEERINDTTWIVAAKYSCTTKESESADTDNSFTFEVTTVDKHLVRAIETYDIVEDADSSGGLINDGAGVDIKFPCATFSETHFFTPAQFNSLRNNIILAAGKINSASFRDFGIKEVLFVGAHGSRNGTSSQDKWQLTFDFAVQQSETITDLTYWKNGAEHAAGSFIKQGWDYLWFRTKTFECEIKQGNEVVGKATEKRVLGAFISQVYYTESFSSALGI